jgi:hypothetical protein
MYRRWLLPLGLLIAACDDTAIRHYTDPNVAVVPDSTSKPQGSADLAYPTDNWGGKVGQRFPNLSFEGVASAATADVPTVINVADYYDPTGKRYDLLHIVIVAMWCSHCDKQATAMADLATWQSGQRVASFELAIDGPNRTGPSMAEVKTWAVKHDLSTPVARDPQSASIKPHLTVSYIPLHLLVNPRTMIILDATTGEVPDLKAYESKFLATVTGG